MPLYLWGWVIIAPLVLVGLWALFAYPRVKSGYDYDKTRCIGEILKDGVEYELVGIDNPKKFKAFLVDLEFIHTGMGRRILYVPPHEGCNSYKVKLMDDSLRHLSEL